MRKQAQSISSRGRPGPWSRAFSLVLLKRFVEHTRETGDAHFARSCPFKHVHAGVARCATGQYIVDQNEPGTLDRRYAARVHRDRAFQRASSGGGGQPA